MSLAPWGHRPALDGLRTLAVYVVIAFHAGLNTFAGGFIGVDLFFVLSGYLVTMVLWTDLEEHGRVRLARFYSRRVRRLVPAALLAITGTAVLSWLVQGVFTRTEWVDDARAAALWFSNWHFIAESADYFAATTEQSPYQHFWSLSIEEQFYVVFPLVLWGLARLAKRRRAIHVALVGLSALALGSLALQLWLTDDTTRLYYGTDTRAYQLLFGAAAALALDHHRKSDRTLPTAVRSIGPALVVAGFAFFVLASTDTFDISPRGRGMAATICALALLVGVECNLDAPPSRLLSLSPITYLGRISYGTYLWHWPIIVFTRARFPETEPWLIFVVAALTATGAAAVSSALLEMPLRRRWPSFPQIPLTAIGVACSVLVAIALPGVLESQRRPPLARAPQSALAQPAAVPETDGTTSTATPSDPETPTSSTTPTASIVAAEALPPATSEPSVSQTPTSDTVNPMTPVPTPDQPVAVPEFDFLDFVRIDRGPSFACSLNTPEACILHAGPPGGLHILLIGDSEAQILANFFVEKGKELGFTVSMHGWPGCPWMQGVLTDNEQWQGPCRRVQSELYSDLLDVLKPDVAIASNLGRLDPQVAEIENFVADDDRYRDRPLEDLLEASLRDSSALLLEKVERLIFIEPIPLPPSDPVDCLSLVDDARLCAFQHLTSTLTSEPRYRKVASEDDRISSIDIDDITCPSHPYCPLVIDDRPVYRDPWHVWPGWYVHRSAELWPIIEPHLPKR